MCKGKEQERLLLLFKRRAFFFARAGRRNFSSDGISLLVYFDCSAGGVSSEVVDSLVLEQVFPVINELLVLLLLLHLC